MRLLSLIISLIIPILLSAQSNTNNLENLTAKANRAFENGEYKQSKALYSDIYLEYGSKEAITKVDQCNQCIELLSNAIQYEREDNCKQAIDCYQSILVINSKDPNVPELIITCRQKLYAPLINQAKQLYREGKYIEARDKLREYTSISGQTDEELLISITECLTWSNEANEAINNKNYDIAKIYLGKILSHNPTDAISAQCLAEVNGLNQKVKTVFVKEPNKNSLRPFKNKFNLFIYSGFSAPVAFGGGVGFNVSFFYLGIDVGGSESSIESTLWGNKYIDDNNLGKFVKIDDNTYTQGTLQLAITPGLNLKYFSAGIGLGTMMTEECSIKETYSDMHYVDVTNKSRFLIRPTVTGLIPFDSDYTGGLMIMAGYNIVSGVSGLNQFILGLGLFF